MQKNLVSIIIVNYNGRHLLHRCIESILENDYKNYEIIVVDNNSNDKSVEFLQIHYPLVKIIKLEKNTGFSYPNNLAAQNVKGNFLFFLNNDTIISKNSISELVESLQNNPSVGICQSLLIKPSGEIDSSGDFLHMLGLPYSSKLKIDKPRKIFSARGAALLIHTSLFQNLGGFNEQFFATFEDVDLCWRSWILGKEVIINPKSVVYHLGGQTINELEELINSHRIKNFLLLNILNLESKKIFSFIFNLPKIILIKKNSSLKNMKSPSLKQIILGFIWILKHLSYVRKTRYTINSKRIISSKQLIEMGLITREFL